MVFFNCKIFVLYMCYGCDVQEFFFMFQEYIRFVFCCVFEGVVKFWFQVLNWEDCKIFNIYKFVMWFEDKDFLDSFIFKVVEVDVEVDYKEGCIFVFGLLEVVGGEVV